MASPAESLILADQWRTSPWRYAQVCSGGAFIPFRHVRYAFNVVAKAILRGNARIIITWPPRHGKSTMVSFWLPVWFLDWFPERRIIMACYGRSLATRWGRMVRNQIVSSPYSWAKIRSDSKSATDFLTTEGGGMLSVGTSGASTGRGADLLLVDDIHKDWEQAQSKVIREKTIEDFFFGTLYTRCEPGASIVINNTRWHACDLPGVLLSGHSDNWVHINMPALAEKGDILGRHTGEALCPERFSVEKLLGIKRAIGSMKFASQFQQRPSPEEGGVIKRAYFQRYRGHPREVARTLTDIIQWWDLAIKGDSQSDFVCGQVWGRSGPKKYLLHQVRERMDFAQTLNAMRTTAEQWPETSAIYIEDAANGPAAATVLRKSISRILTVTPKGSKYARLAAVSPQYEAGDILHPDPSICPWVLDTEEELVTFPNAENDDTVDCVSGALGRYLYRPDTGAEFAL